MKVIVVGSIKGGEGKTTVATNLAVAGVLDGKSVLLVDADTQLSSLTFRALRTLGGIKAIPVKTPTVHTDIAAFKEFDLVIVDAGGHEDAVFRSAILAAAYGIMIIPIRPGQYAATSVKMTLGLLAEVRERLPIHAYILFNGIAWKVNTQKESMEYLVQLAEKNAVPVLQSRLGLRFDFETATTKGMGIMEFAPASKSATEMRALYTEVMAELEKTEEV